MKVSNCMTLPESIKNEQYKRTVIKDGKTWRYYKNRNTLSKSERFIKGFEATLAVIFTLGFSLFSKQIRRLFKESVRGWENHKIYLVNQKPQIKSLINSFFSNVNTHKKCQPPLNAVLFYEVNGKKKQLTVLYHEKSFTPLQKRLKKELEPFSRVKQLDLKFNLLIDQQDEILQFTTVSPKVVPVKMLNEKTLYINSDHYVSYKKADIPEMIEQNLWDPQEAKILNIFINPL